MKLADKLKTLFKRRSLPLLWWNGKVLFEGKEYQSMDEAMPKILDAFFKDEDKAEDKKEQ